MASPSRSQTTCKPPLSVPLAMSAPIAINPLRVSHWRNALSSRPICSFSPPTNWRPPSNRSSPPAKPKDLTVKLVPVAEIYDEFGGGEATPESLQAFIAYAHQNWQTPQPRYLLLVGDATSDYYGYLETPMPANHVPSFLVPVAYSGETVSDSRLADVDGDTVPDLAVGRWPVNTVEEAASLVARTLAYEQGTAVNQALFAADGTEAQFTSMAQNVADKGGLPAANTQILTGPQSGEVTDRLNDGAWLAAYVGHGSLNQWGKEQIFTRETLAGLDVETPPILVQLTCLTGLFAQPDQRSLTEEMLLHDSGPVLSIAATSLTLSSHQEPFAASFVQALLDPEITRIGDAFQAAKLSLDVSNPGLREISDTFALFGDPSARINRPGALVMVEQNSQNHAPPPKKPIWTWLSLLLTAVLLIIGLWYVMQRVTLTELEAALSSAQPLYILLSLLTVVLTLLVKSWRWQALLTDPSSKPAFGPAFWSLNLGAYVNLILPFMRLGEVARLFAIDWTAHVGKARALGTIVVEKVVDLFMLALSLLLILPFIVLPGFMGNPLPMITAVSLAALSLPLPARLPNGVDHPHQPPVCWLAAGTVGEASHGLAHRWAGRIERPAPALPDPRRHRPVAVGAAAFYTHTLLPVLGLQPASGIGRRRADQPGGAAGLDAAQHSR
jgi:hypothetical protein